MKLRSLSAALVLAGLTAATTQANAAFPGSGADPGLFDREKSVFIGLESVLSALAAAIEAGDCTDFISPIGIGIYEVEAESDNAGKGYAQLDLFRVDVDIFAEANKGELWDATGTGSIDGEPITDYLGTYGTDEGGSMLYGAADMIIHGDLYDEHIIKDFWRAPAGPDKDAFEVLDDGLEMITKQDYPRAKWYQESMYTRDNGDDGAILWTKIQIAPDGADLGTMTLSATTDGFGDGLKIYDGFLILECASVDNPISPPPGS